jgi:hypothetical protein
METNEVHTVERKFEGWDWGGTRLKGAGTVRNMKGEVKLGWRGRGY